jgi:catechol-2,3-dioxygenase
MVREAAIQAFNKSMSFGLVKNAAEIAEEFELPQEMKLQAAMKSYEQHMQAGLYHMALKIAQKYKLPEEMVQAAEKKIS